MASVWDYLARTPLPESVALELGAEFLPLNEVLAAADFVSLHCPATPETRNLIDAQALPVCVRRQSLLILLEAMWSWKATPYRR